VSSIENILQETSHRPFPMPETPWKYYQEWHKVLFAHWKVAAPSLIPLIPAGLTLDLFNGEAWVSLVAFTIKRLRPRFLPPFPPLSNFHEINMRTYVIRNGKPGIYFLSIEAQKFGSALMVKLVTGLPYVHSKINRAEGYYTSKNKKLNFHLHAEYKPEHSTSDKSVLDRWLTDRFCLFHELSNNIYSHDIHHQDWPLEMVDIRTLDLQYQFKEIVINRRADLYHYADGVQVPTWGKRRA
jgi:uncharacterized protein YqjF (DUF2071 family)